MDRATFFGLHLALAALALHLAALRGPSCVSVSDIPEPLAAIADPVLPDLPAVPAAQPKPAPRATVRVASVRLDARALEAGRLFEASKPSPMLAWAELRDPR